jgi:peptidoglycan endopeptidase LytE
MFVRKLFPYAVSAFTLTAMFSITVVGQSANLGVKQSQSPATLDHQEIACSLDDVALMSIASEDLKPISTVLPALPVNVSSDRFRQLISAAIDERLGSRYRWGGTGPNGFDCSGFVWSVFQSVGVDFERGSARELWVRFEPPAPEERFRFGTLVFFRNLAHVGVVADQNGFYHASRHHGVIYSPFNDYWKSRIDGFRKVPLAGMVFGD